MKDCAFFIGQRVAVLDTDDVEGNVQQILFSIDGIQIQISYWADKIRRVEWVMPYEIEPAKRTDKRAIHKV